MAQTKNLCAQIPLDLHAQVYAAKEDTGLTTSEYITQLLIEYYEIKKNGGNAIMSKNNTRTLAFQISEDLFQRIKTHLERETARTGKKTYAAGVHPGIGRAGSGRSRMSSQCRPL